MNRLCATVFAVFLLVLFVSSQVVDAGTNSTNSTADTDTGSNHTTSVNSTTTDKNSCDRSATYSSTLFPLALAAALLYDWSQ